MEDWCQASPLQARASHAAKLKQFKSNQSWVSFLAGDSDNERISTPGEFIELSQFIVFKALRIDKFVPPGWRGYTYQL